MKHIIYILGLIVFVSCSTSKKTLKIEKVNDYHINRENYFEFFVQKPGLHTGSLDKNEILEIILKDLDTRGFKVVRNALFEFDDGTIIPISGYLPYEKVGFYLEPTVSYPKKSSMRTNPHCEYYKYSSEGKAYIQSFKQKSDRLFIFKTNWYWYQDWTSDYEKEKNKNIVLVSKDKAYEILKADIDLYFDKVERVK